MSEIAKPRGLRALYAWMLENAQGPHALAALALFAFAEASFSHPARCDAGAHDGGQPPPLFRHRGLVHAVLVLGGALGYAIGALFWDTAGLWIIHALHIPLAKVMHYRETFSAHAYMILVQGMTPIPTSW